MIRVSTTSHILNHLNKQQQEAVAFEKGPLLVLAGAGSGKTRVLTYRAAWLIEEKKIDPEKILLLTFTNKAAQEMRERIKKLVPNQTAPFAGTFHSFSARLLRKEAQHLNLSPGFVIYDRQDQIEAIKQTLKALGLDPKQHKPGLILNLISQAKNELISASEYGQYTQTSVQETASKAYLLYEQLLKKAQALDFDDLLLKTLYLLEQNKAVLQKYQQQFEWVLVDEYQDTNRIQYLLTQFLTKPQLNLTAVGDACQSIYSWRGADFRNLVNLQKDLPQLTTINLEQNYRSSQTILKAANQVILKNTSHPVLNLWSQKKGGDKIIIYQAQSELDEAFFIVSQVKQLLREGKFDYKDTAILYRTNAQSRVLEEAFLHQSIPYSIIGGLKFYERKEVKDCLAYLRLVTNPQDQVSFLRATKIGKRRLKKFQELREEEKNLKEKPTKEILEKVLQATTYLEKLDENDPQDLARLENIKELSSVATKFPDLNDFLENVSLVQMEYFPQGSDQKQEKGVTLMTMHAAKGTEFPVVFLAGMEEGLFPHSKTLLDRQELEEERRLCYVGLTRAKEKLFLTFSEKRLFFGSISTNPPSRFIEEISPSLVLFLKDHHQC